MNASGKYEKARNEIRNGDVILFRGNSILSRTIQWGDSSYYNHSGIAIRLGSRLLILDSNSPGVHPDFLSIRMAEYADFCIVRINNGFSQTEIDSCVNRVIDRSESSQIKYEFSLLPKIALARKCGIKMRINENESRDICSTFTGYRYLAQAAGIKAMLKAKTDQGWITPADHLRYASIEDSQLKVLFEDSKC